MDTNQSINIIEVGPRDGFQSIDQYIPLEKKLEIIDGIVASGVQQIEHTSFVSPRAIPQLKDAKELTEFCLEKYPSIDFFPLVPNLYGASSAYELGLRKIAYVVSLSKSHNKANINRSHEQSFTELKKIIDAYPDMKVSLSLATTFGCPFEGKFNTETIVNFLESYVKELGIDDIVLCDTIGIAVPNQVREIIHTLKEAYPYVNYQGHIHDTRNMGMVNTLAAIEMGITDVQTTLGGLGGCPFAPGASGNLATEDLVYMLNESGYKTGVNFKKILEIAKYEKQIIDGTYSSHQTEIQYDF